MKITKIIHTVKDFKKLRSDWFRKDFKVGFIPTMGALHQGHANLMKNARNDNDIVVSSIFVNPAQFGPAEDLQKYPRTLDSDIKVLSQVDVDYCFVPSVQEMYPSGISMNVHEQIGTFVTVHGKSHQMEGSIRPHFFRGVATVVAKLFNIIHPTTAYFGQKDVQQCSVIKTMVSDLHFPVEVVIVDTVRESDGLAMSSRNRYLSQEERSVAPILYAALQAALIEFQAGTRDRKVLIDAAMSVIRSEPRVQLQYFSLADPIYLKEIETVVESGGILSGAIQVGNTRIIDNMLLGIDTRSL